jgi:uroporphyrinogen III methyltransferase / synthase
MEHTVLVYIVGAGPGDPSLITVRGMTCLQRADVVVYDRKVAPRLLELAPAHAERIEVGAAAPKPLDQDAISYLLAEKAREGRVVVRLKWGDPYVFDSGGKEAIFLHEQRIPFEVVPGIPLAVAGPAYSGVPLTYPEAGDVIVLVRGNEAETDALPHVDWSGVAGLRGTLACYAGARQIEGITRALLAHGRQPGEAAVLIYSATTPLQQTVQATLENIAQRAFPDRPALLVVGAVVGLRDHLRWFDNRPLFGRRIVVTRSREQAGDLVDRLEALGAETIGIPTIRILPAEDTALMNAACGAAHTFHWLVFTSVNGVEYFMKHFLGRRDIRDLKDVRICTVGPATTAAMERYGVRVDLTPAEYRGEAVISALMTGDSVRGTRFLLPRSQIARELLADELRAAGGDVLEVAAYTTAVTADKTAPDVYRMLLDRTIDAITFTSASTVRNFVQLVGEEQASDLLRSTVVAAIGPVTAEAAEQLGIATTVMPSEYTIPALVDALVHHFNRHPDPAAVPS